MTDYVYLRVPKPAEHEYGVIYVDNVQGNIVVSHEGGPDDPCRPTDVTEQVEGLVEEARFLIDNALLAEALVPFSPPRQP